MKSIRFSHFAAPLLGLFAGSVLVYASTEVTPPSGATITASTDVSPPAPVAATDAMQVTAVATPVVGPGEDIVSPSWTKIADCNYDSRARFIAGLQDLETKADAQIRELDAKRRSMPVTVDTKDWDFQMKEMVDARSYLKDMASEVRKAGPDNWDERKEKVGFAWDRLQNAYAHVKASTTS